jgi:hypothetical protein
MRAPARLHPDDLRALVDGIAAAMVDGVAEAILDGVVGRLERSDAMARAGPLVDAAEVARRFDVDRAWVYSHAAELGAVRLGDGPRPRLRFDLERVVRALTARASDRSGREAAKPTAARNARRLRSRRTGTGVELLPIRGSADRPP